jgi:hypothetical protein
VFGGRFRHLPLILTGVLDPRRGAHGPDESLHLGVFEMGVVTTVFLLEERSRLARGALPPDAPSGEP